MKLDDVPTVEWETVGVGSLSYEQHRETRVYSGIGYAIIECKHHTQTYAKTVAKAKRYVEIRIHCAAIEQALIEELGGNE